MRVLEFVILSRSCIRLPPQTCGHLTPGKGEGAPFHQPPPMNDARPLTKECPAVVTGTMSWAEQVHICPQLGCHCASYREVREGSKERPELFKL
eukprot:7380099-Pyramimonas_sp.AAC.1